MSFTLSPKLKEDFKAKKRREISSDEWKERRRTAFADVKTIITVVGTNYDKNDGEITSEKIIFSSRINDIWVYENFVIWMTSSRSRAHYDIALDCDENTIKLSLT